VLFRSKLKEEGLEIGQKSGQDGKKNSGARSDDPRRRRETKNIDGGVGKDGVLGSNPGGSAVWKG